jgi:hypothetical protein
MNPRLESNNGQPTNNRYLKQAKSSLNYFLLPRLHTGYEAPIRQHGYGDTEYGDTAYGDFKKQ